jgi:NAD-dependent SIR2 family protein deacetylase
MLNVTQFKALEKTALLNIKYFNHGNLQLKGCRACDKLVKHNHTKNPRFKKENRFVYICECAECNTPMLLDDVDFYLLYNKV